MRKILLFVLLLVGLGVSASADEVCMPLMPSSPLGQFGCSVYLKGPSLVVGSHLDGGGSITAYHQEADGTWSSVADGGGKIRANDGQPGDQFGSSAWIDGNWLAVGAPFANGSGAVYLFQRATETSGWVQAIKLTASDGVRGDQFGLAVAISGTTLIVGAPNVVGNAGSLSGAVYVFHFDGNTWAPRQKLAASDAAPFDNFGFSLAIDGSTLIVGAPFHDRGSAGGNAGAAYVFGQDAAGTWSQRVELTASDGLANDEFGSAVTLSGGSLAVGARADDANGLVDVGSAYVYQLQGDASWREVAHFLGQAAGDRFGAAVSMSGNRLLIGALLHGGGSPEPGAAYLFARTDGTWAPEPFSFPAGAVTGRFGQAVSIDGENFLVGAYLAAPSGAGAATVCGPGPTPPGSHTFKVVKDDGQTEVSPGQVLTYTLTVTNKGKEDATAVQVTDPVSAKLRDVSCQPDCVRASSGILTWTIPLASRASKILHVTGTVRADATGSLTNTACAQVLGEAKAFCGSDPPDEIAAGPCIGAVDLALVKIAPASAQPGHRITYTLTATNQGTCPATGVRLMDLVPAELQAVSATLPTCSIKPRKIVCALPDLAPRASATVDLQFDVLETCIPTITNLAKVSANEELAVSSKPTSTNVVRVANLTLTKSGPATVKPGDSVPYLLTVTNQGPDIACGVVISDPVPAWLASPGGPCSTPDGVRCEIDELAANASRTFPVSFTASPVAPCGTRIVNRATVSAVPPSADPQPADDDGTVTATFVEDLSITKTVSRATASPGDVLTYVIVVNNPGASPATVADLFPAGLTQIHWCRDGNGPCSPNHPGDLHDVLSDATATYRVQATVSPMSPDMLVNTATAMGSPGCPDPDLSNNSAKVMTVVTPAPGVTIFCEGIDGSQVAGGTVTYTFLLLNGGPAAQSNAMFSDPLPAGLTFVSASASSGTVTLGNPVTWNGPIPVGGMVTITITAMIGPMTKGMTFCNAPSVAFDRDGDGIDESAAFAVPCCFLVPQVIPALSGSALMVLALLLTLVALRRLRRRSL
jgi:uncharacterized repeat protein (TIGR01451 family)